jgi:hypothetical protein
VGDIRSDPIRHIFIFQFLCHRNDIPSDLPIVAAQNSIRK